jgi:hypothetical protein
VNALSNNNNWWFQYWHAWSKLSTMRWSLKVYIIQWNFQFLKITTIYDTHIDDILTNAATQQCMYVKSCWNILNLSQANIFCIQTPVLYSKRSLHKLNKNLLPPNDIHTC